MEQNAIFSNPLSRQARDIPEFMEVINKNLHFVYLMESITMKEIHDIKKIIITGCGDSYLAGLAMKPLMEKLTGLEVEDCKNIDLSRYYPSERLGSTPNNPLVILISVSGSISRILEAAQRANAYGANTLAITNDKNTPLAKECNRVLELNTPPVERAPGCSAYVASCFALLAFCIRVGRVIQSYEPAEEDRIRAIAMNYIRTFSQDVTTPIAEQMRNLAETWKDLQSFDIVGDSGAFASAQFGAWKFVESFGGITNAEDSENWLHENFLYMEPEKIGTVIFADKNSPSYSRCLETAAVMKRIGRPTLVITDGNSSDFPEGVTICKIPSAEDYMYNPLMQHIPLLFLGSYIGEFLGRHYYREGDGDNWQDSSGVYPIRTSKIVIV